MITHRTEEIPPYARQDDKKVRRNPPDREGNPLPHDHYEEEIKRTDRTSQGGNWAFAIGGGLLVIGTIILFLAPPTNVYAIAGACTVAGSGVTVFALGVILRTDAAAMTGGHEHYQCIEQRQTQLLTMLDKNAERLAVIERTLGSAAGDDLADHRRRNTR